MGKSFVIRVVSKIKEGDKENMVLNENHKKARIEGLVFFSFSFVIFGNGIFLSKTKKWHFKTKRRKKVLPATS